MFHVEHRPIPHDMAFHVKHPVRPSPQDSASSMPRIDRVVGAPTAHERGRRSSMEMHQADPCGIDTCLLRCYCPSPWIKGFLDRS